MPVSVAGWLATGSLVGILLGFAVAALGAPWASPLAVVFGVGATGWVANKVEAKHDQS